MKTKMLKFALPAIAILFAVSLAFATEADAPLNTGYIAGPTGPITVQVDCQSEIPEACIAFGQQVYKNQDLTEPMTKSQP